jgi:hypothetical protein
MPVLNSRGDVLAGVAGHPTSLNGVPLPFATFGGACWLDDETVLVQIPAPAPLGAILATWRPGASQPTPLPQQRGANDYAAGGGRFIAWLAGVGCWGSLGDMPAAGVPNSGTPFAHLAVAPNGTIGYVPDGASGYGIKLVDPDGIVSEAVGVWALDEQTLDERAAVWRGGALGTAIPLPALPAVNLQVVDLPDGERWLVYWSDPTGFIVQKDGAADGYILGNAPIFFNHHARAVGADLWVAWSSTSGEAFGDISVVRIDRTAPRVALEPPVSTEPPPSTEPPDIEEPPPSTEPPDIEEPPPSTEPPDELPPEPEPPKEAVMLFIETKYEKNNPKLSVMKFEIIKNADGTESYKSVARATSADADEQATPFYCVTDVGTDEWRKTPGGAFESFRRVGTSLVADRPWSTAGGPTKQNAYVRYCVEVP